MKKTLDDFNFYGKRVLVRVDFNVPMKDGVISDDLRIVEALSTIKYLLNNNAKVILCSHLGRPDGKFDEKLSLMPVCERLKTYLPLTRVNFANTFDFEILHEKVEHLDKGELLLLDNIRFLEGEENNDTELSLKLASLADIFVFDAFGTAHRKHCSTYGVSAYLPSCMGRLVQKEIEVFDKVLNTPKRPLVAILGGGKIGDKLLVTENLLSKVDVMLIGGGMCFTFLKALKGDIGKSIVDESKIDYCYNVIKSAIKQNVTLVLPVDFICSKSLEKREEIITLEQSELGGDYMGLDIGPKTIELFSKYIKKAKTLVWNGPMGAYEYNEFSNGTKQIAESVARNKHCKSVAGGGDVVAAIEKYNLADSFYHISTGGGASLKLLEGSTLVCVDALEDRA